MSRLWLKQRFRSGGVHQWKYYNLPCGFERWYLQDALAAGFEIVDIKNEKAFDIIHISSQNIV